MTASPTPLKVVSGAPGVTGKAFEFVPPVNHTLPAVSQTRSPAESKSQPPTKVENTIAEPAGFTFVTKASPLVLTVSNAPGVIGQPADVPPLRYALPVPSTTRPLAPSKSGLPMKVE